VQLGAHFDTHTISYFKNEGDIMAKSKIEYDGLGGKRMPTFYYFPQ